MAIEIVSSEIGKPGSGNTFRLEGDGPFRIGRSDSNHLQLENKEVSRSHAEITVDREAIRIADLGSQNGTYLASRRITSGRWAEGDEVQIGPFLLSARLIEDERPRRVEAPQPPERPVRRDPVDVAAPGPPANDANAQPWAAQPRQPEPARQALAPRQREAGPVGGAPVQGGPQPRAGGLEPWRIGWSGNPWDLVGLSFTNFFLTIVTLGIYSFWGKTEVRKRIWSSVRLQDEPLAYTGTGKELFLGFLIVFGAVFLPITLLTFFAMVAFGPQSGVSSLVQLLIYIVFFFLWGVAVYRARRYRLSRTLWRGIRGGMAGSSAGFAWTNFWTAILIPFTLGWILPWRANVLQKQLNSETTFGNRQMAYQGNSGPLYKYFAALWVGGLVLYLAVIGIIAAFAPSLQAEAEAAARQGMEYKPSLKLVLGIIFSFFAAGVLWSIISAWYQSQKFRLFAGFTSFDQGRFTLDTTALGLIGVFISNFLLSALTLGILKPVAQARIARYFVERLSLEGTADVASILQSTAALEKRGEGLAQGFDVDAF